MKLEIQTTESDNPIEYKADAMQTIDELCERNRVSILSLTIT